MMQEWVPALLEVQDLDLRVGRLKMQLAEVPEKAEETKRMYQAEEDAFEAARKTVQEREVAIRKNETEISAIQDQKRNFQSKTALIRNNDEYRAALLQIEMCDKAISDLETAQLEAMYALDSAKETLRQREQSLTEAKHRASGVIDELRVRKQNCEEQLASLAEKRPALAAAVPPEILAKYERLFNSRANHGRPCCVPILPGTSEEGPTCGRCHIGITPQTLSNCLKGMVVQCGECTALLYLE